MFQACDREGIFRAQIDSYGIREMDTGAVCVAIHAQLLECWSGEGWDKWEEYQMNVQGDLYIVKKDKTINSGQVENLIKFAGWDGTIESIVNESWKPTQCQIVVTKDEYKGKVRFRAAFINAYDKAPGAMSNVDSAKAKELTTKYGAQLRAIAGNAKRNGTAAPTSTKPAAPPPAPAPMPQKAMGRPPAVVEEPIPQ